jgi:hypothetical protein
MLSDNEKLQIRQMLQNPQWQAIEHLITETCANLESESTVRETEWDTVKTTLTNDGMIKGIRHLSQEIWKHAHDQN